ncbi:Protein unc-87 [Trichinella spiralis]|uniref:Protein unc-87 n=1 Tax=Trichinella spiralis TaxID=6334 RepID=A0ABR3KBH2_TRISP
MENDERSPPQKRRIPVVIPCSIPWESRPCLQNQCGMSAFGSCRNAVLKPTAAAEKQAPSSSHNNDPFLSLFASTNVGASQKGMRSFGAHRENVSKSISSKQFSHDKAKITETIIPKQSIGSVASQLHLSAPIGSPRQHVMRIDSATGQKMDPMSNTFLTKSAAPNPNSHAGTSIMDRFRKQVLATDDKTEMHHDRQTESLLPRWSDRSGLVSPTGTGAGVSGLGPHRQVITHVIDQCPLTDEMITDMVDFKSDVMLPLLRITTASPAISIQLIGVYKLAAYNHKILTPLTQKFDRFFSRIPKIVSTFLRFTMNRLPNENAQNIHWNQSTDNSHLINITQSFQHAKTHKLHVKQIFIFINTSKHHTTEFYKCE